MPRGDPCSFPYTDGYPYNWMGRPRRMARAEVILWHWFIANYSDRYVRVWFDVMVPSDPALAQPLVTCPSGDVEKWLWVWHCLTCLRADVLGFTGSTYQIIEIRSDARFATPLQANHITDLFIGRYSCYSFLPPLIISDFVPDYIKMSHSLAKVELIERESYPT